MICNMTGQQNTVLTTTDALPKATQDAALLPFHCFDNGSVAQVFVDISVNEILLW